MAKSAKRLITSGGVETDFGVVRVAASEGRTTLVVEVETDADYRRQVLKGPQIAAFREMVDKAFARLT